MAQHLVHRFRSLVTWATTPHRRPARRHSRGRARPAPVPMSTRASRPMTPVPGARALVPAGPRIERVVAVTPQTVTPTLRHLGVVGMPGTIGAAARSASARAAAERRFNGSDPRARIIDPRHPSMWRP